MTRDAGAAIRPCDSLADFSRGPNDRSETDIGDFTGNDIWVQGRNNAWYQVADTDLRPFGWVNRPYAPW